MIHLDFSLPASSLKSVILSARFVLGWTAVRQAQRLTWLGTALPSPATRPVCAVSGVRGKDARTRGRLRRLVGADLQECSDCRPRPGHAAAGDFNTLLLAYCRYSTVVFCCCWVVLVLLVVVIVFVGC